MLFGVVTLFPQYFRPLSKYGIISRAQKQGIIDIRTINPRKFSSDKYQTVDDTPYGGGAGMVMIVRPLMLALHKLYRRIPVGGKGRVLLMSAGGSKFDQHMATELALLDYVVLICGRYEGIDQRVADYLCDGEISVGDYVLSGGELAAACVIDSVSRLIPGVLGSSESLDMESFSSGGLEYPQYSKPESFYGWEVPKVLLSGHHKEITKWRRAESKRRTSQNRPDLQSEDQD